MNQKPSIERNTNGGKNEKRGKKEKGKKEKERKGERKKGRKEEKIGPAQNSSSRDVDDKDTVAAARRGAARNRPFLWKKAPAWQPVAR